MSVDDERWQAIRDRDDATFLYGVRSTGIYCRPTCPSRRPRRENVVLFDSAADAAAAGFRPCKRCDPSGPGPEQRRVELVAAACRLIEDSHEVPNLSAVATTVGMSPFHFHRTFKAVIGLTPRAYAEAHRSGRLRERLAEGANVTDAIYEAGYG